MIVLIAFILLVSLIVGVVIECLNASHSVSNEMRYALQVGRQSVIDARTTLARSPSPDRDLESLVASFNGNRHLRVTLTAPGHPTLVAEPNIEHSPFGRAARWFVALLRVPVQTERITVNVAGRVLGTVRLQTDPHNEILEAWNEFNDSMIVLGLFCVQVIVMIVLLVSRALHPLQRLALAIKQVADGDYHTRIPVDPSPELSPLCVSFNHMADRLAATAAENRRLNERLLTLQEQERRDLASDLHDEISPFLFAIKIDIAGVTQLLHDGRIQEISGSLNSIRDAVDHMQSEVRNILARLRPAGLAEFGLGEAIDGMVQFWRHRHPDVNFITVISERCAELDNTIAATAYRIVQEALSNAMRHGEPGQVRIEIKRAHSAAVGSCLDIEVVDDGGGLDNEASAGFGLLGMSERARAVGGELTVNTVAGGVRIHAILPIALPANSTAICLST